MFSRIAQNPISFTLHIFVELELYYTARCNSRNELDSHDGQFLSFQQCTTELLDITVVNIMEVVTSLEHKLEYIVGTKSQFRRIQRKTHKRNSPST